MKNILIVKIGAIGDVVMCLPLITEIRKKYPEAKITWLCGKQVLPLLERVEGIDDFVVTDETRLLKGPLPLRILEIIRVWKQLLFRQFDLRLYFYKSPLYRVLCLPAFFKETRGFGKMNSGPVLPVTGRHHSLEYIQAFLQKSGAYMLQPEYPVFKNLPPLHKRRSGEPAKIVLACGGARNLLQNNDVRRWPLEHYHKLGSELIAAGHTLVLTGGPGDLWVKEAFADVPHEDLIGKLSLTGFIDFLAGADLLITHDSGPLHLADLAGCPVLGLFGPTRPADFRSLQEKSKHIWGGAGLSCRPCYDGKDYGVCSSNDCLKSVGPEEVFKLASSMLEG